MSKYQKMFYVEDYIIENLKNEENASKIVNNLLKDYYNYEGNLSKETLMSKISELDLEKTEIENKIKRYEKELKKIQEKENKIKNILSGFPKEIIEEIKTFPKINEEILEERFNKIYKRKFGISLEELKKVFKILKGGQK